jgi:hypothetical protein
VDGFDLEHKSEAVNPDRNYRVTFFKNLAATEKAEHELTYAQLVTELRRPSAPSKDMLPLFRLGQFGNRTNENGCLRYDANVTAFTGAMGDYDSEKVPIAVAYEKLTEHGVKAILYTTASHTDTTPRWRVIAPYAEPIIVDPADPEAAARKHLAYTDMLNGIVGGVLAVESWNLSQAFYYGYVETEDGDEPDDYNFFVVDGQEIDTIEGLPSQEKPTGKPVATRTAVPRSTVDWDTSQADDFRTRGEPWTIKRTRLERGRARRSARQGLARWRSGAAAGCHASARVRQCSGYCAGKTWKPSRANWASRQRH